MADVILVINSGSSSIKFSIYKYHQTLNLLYHGEIESISESPCLTISNPNHQEILKQAISTKGTEAGLRAVFNWFEHLPESMTLKAVGHRIVHGGKYFRKPALVTDAGMKQKIWKPFKS
jgi:acetate kinase